MAHESFRFLLDKCGCGFGLWQSKSHLSSGAYKILFQQSQWVCLKARGSFVFMAWDNLFPGLMFVFRGFAMSCCVLRVYRDVPSMLTWSELRP
ncbi:hypothetical protein HanRHA438_Chr04g0159331 [Helianthus annuus]|uniref:Uncharacterized protein n=1 Tax=Helianthus annuus TaxID=4232 RepID=A0A251UVR9_HELAN|nr:hypothetical protein HanXRQr2_Chr04g0149421 [Helianthus annuus]KAJ0587187.1 hypothetical protein HanIR_Chr04g0160371 [Helianthus annuus]KAJ0595777.1 hypothetical protein HanHA89_Chr04g0135281 [Helianthus annuus]KAJ0756435.1 hypothetical protein HanLR1_Chr04g0127121 [Helianthus annuus]KAJ0925400.1 hypothetical protein HanRHA438_Chr04g0159331 [Helianthus annuus]